MKYLIYILLLVPSSLLAQQQLEGRILDAATEEKTGLAGANVVWLNTEIGSVTDFDGNFTIPYKSEYSKLIISYVGYATDTVTVSSNKRLEHALSQSTDLEAVKISARRKASSRSILNTQNTILVSSDELLKAACCNLSESFETNPSIDVNFADAITGTRQIKMLGLKSPYILIATENIPAIRGAAQIYGLSFIPGTWVESIQITKGAGSVVNGFESIAGQINTELQKPSKDFPVLVNVYGAVDGRFELNTHLNTKGVKSAVWSIESHMLSLIYDERKTNLDTIHSNIARVGHDTEKVTATKEAYLSVNECCRYCDEGVIDDHNDN